VKTGFDFNGATTKITNARISGESLFDFHNRKKAHADLWLVYDAKRFVTNLAASTLLLWKTIATFRPRDGTAADISTLRAWYSGAVKRADTVFPSSVDTRGRT